MFTFEIVCEAALRSVNHFTIVFKFIFLMRSTTISLYIMSLYLYYCLVYDKFIQRVYFSVFRLAVCCFKLCQTFENCQARNTKESMEHIQVLVDQRKIEDIRQQYSPGYLGCIS